MRILPSNANQTTRMKDPFVVFSDYIAGKRLKMTPQRRRILEIFLNTQGHLTAEDIYRTIKETYDSIGQATVYRTMKLLAESGLAKAVEFGDGAMRYELKYGQEHHDHLICERCGVNVEVVDPEIEALQEKVAAANGFVLTGHKMYLYGLCPSCRAEKRDLD